VLSELSRRITAVEDEVRRVRELADKSGDTAMNGAVSDLSERLAHLRAGFDALQ
jgi:hypothetical protein